jgi:uncharacterized protein (DUF2267 family)
MDRAELIRAVRAAAEFEDDFAAEAAIAATLGVLGERMFEIDARVIAAQLPGAWSPLLDRTGAEEVFDLDELYRRVAAREKVPLGRALEHAQVVCAAVGERLDESGLAHLRLRLPAPFVDLFERRPPTAEAHRGAPAAPAARAGGPTLASGRPGARHPISEGRSTRAHSGSVAANSDPHADTRLSSTRGATQQREHEDLASGRPGSPRPISSRDDE